MKQGTKRLVSMALALVAVVSSFAIFFQGIQPEYSLLQRQRGERQSRESLVETQKKAVETVRRLINQYSAESSEFQAVSLSLPLGPDLGNTVVQLVGLANLSGLRIQSLAPKIQGVVLPNRDELIKPTGQVAFDIQAQGSYSSLTDFLRKVESNTMVFEVRNLSAKTVKPGTDQLTINFQIISYYQVL